jgi:hypothetical protein
MTQTTPVGLSPKLAAVVQKVRDLQELTRTTGFRTTRSVGEVLGRLTADELAEVSAALQQR